MKEYTTSPYWAEMYLLMFSLAPVTYIQVFFLPLFSKVRKISGSCFYFYWYFFYSCGYRIILNSFTFLSPDVYGVVFESPISKDHSWEMVIHFFFVSVTTWFKAYPCLRNRITIHPRKERAVEPFHIIYKAGKVPLKFLSPLFFLFSLVSPTWVSPESPYLEFLPIFSNQRGVHSLMEVLWLGGWDLISVNLWFNLWNQKVTKHLETSQSKALWSSLFICLQVEEHNPSW